MKLKGEIEEIGKRFERSPRCRPVHAMLLNAGISCSAYLVQKVLKFANLTGLSTRRKYSKSNYSPEIGNLTEGNFQSSSLHDRWIIEIPQKRYLSGTT